MKTPILISAVLLALSATATHAQTASSSTDPEYTYRVTANSPDAYRVTVTSFNGPFHYRDVPLQRRNCSGNVGSPAMSDAEMLLLVQPAGTVHATFRVPMSAGGSGCEITGEFDLQALDRPQSIHDVDLEMPSQKLRTKNEVDPEQPGQGQNPRTKHEVDPEQPGQGQKLRTKYQVDPEQPGQGQKPRTKHEVDPEQPGQGQKPRTKYQVDPEQPGQGQKPRTKHEVDPEQPGQGQKLRTKYQVDQEQPGQGQKPRMMQLTDGINDLRAADPVQIGRNLINWGDVTTLPAWQATVRRNGVCYFPYRYITLNAGPDAAEGTSNSLRRNSINGQLLALDDLPALSPMSATTVSGQIGLPSGLSAIVLETDAPEYLAKSHVLNNVRSVTVSVQGSCD